MKILYLHQYFTTPSMSGGTRSYEMARRLASAGHDVHIVTTWRTESDRKGWWTEKIDGVTIHWLPVVYSNHMGFWPRVGAFARFALQSARRAVAIGGDVVFATSTPLTIALPGVLAARKLKRPMVFEVRDLWPLLPIAIGALRNPLMIWAARWLERLAYRNSHTIIALSPGMADGVAATGYDRDRIHVIPNGCDRDLFFPDEAGSERFRAQRPELGDGPIVLYAGTIGQINGVSYLADLASHLIKLCPDARCVVIGAGAEEAKLRQRAAQLDVLGRNFFLYPAMKKLDLVDAFRAASVSTSLFINLPDMWHNSANKFFDGLASGKAVAINYGGWQAELLEKHGCGIALGPEPEEGARRLAAMLANPDEIATMGKKSQKVAEELFDRDKLSAQFIEVIETSAGRARVGIMPV
jgi:glycosyltransferase involved in cell wall biosynthesis